VTCAENARSTAAEKGTAASNATESAGPFSILRHFER
jgi:hypothetical protein